MVACYGICKECFVYPIADDIAQQILSSDLGLLILYFERINLL